ncbi:uncharacterized protein (DUF1684 family) [Crossiella equi]|uniref:Uncharacterized protein (DUF1684 family) n=1 Tax=Crossiella equi TaxID=130796 RepID=A0ABS5AQN7_9PSEU|nr:DUF1684 domain-containing protein [Crossiella equi]MBP2478883.1 uncharacterized protein (DUF1684 family) [Crossiella equi]
MAVDPAQVLTQRWLAWHEAREAAVTAPHGLAALDATHWLTTEFQAYDGAPGRWRHDGEAVHAKDLPLAEIESTVDLTGPLAEGDSFRYRGSQFLVFARDGAPALRQYDPEAVRRKNIDGIDAWQPDPAWLVPATWTPSTDGTTVKVTAIDGYVSGEVPTGYLTLTLDGQELRLTTTGTPDHPKIVFSDGTSGNEGYRFRFLQLDEVLGEHPHVDFNRAYLPPCAFSDHYVCPMPLPENRLPVPVRAGERGIRHG